MICDYIDLTKQNGYFSSKRQEQAKYRMIEMINETLKDEFYSNQDVSILLPVIEKELLSQKISSYIAAQKLLDAYFKSLKKK
jgi:LAO/AO transport system kinase